MKWMIQTADAVAHLHSCNVVHRDLKADNVLLTASEDVKLGDFGLAREYIALKRADVQLYDGSWLTNYTQYYMQSGIGPIHWVAPEFFRGRRFLSRNAPLCNTPAGLHRDRRESHLWGLRNCSWCRNFWRRLCDGEF